jgi:GR25 family glycosyltransferase involved in LPS biosynthesis
MSFSDLFDNIYLINLTRRKDRLKLMKYTLNKLKIKYELFVAYDYHNDNIITNKFIKSHGSIGLIVTYQRLLQDAIDKNYETILILEDDISFSKNFDECFKNYCNNRCNSTYPIVYLGANQNIYDQDQLNVIKSYSNQSNNHKAYIVNNNYTYTYGTYSIVIHKTLFKILLDSIGSIETMKCPIDMHINHILAEYKLKGKVLFPFMVMPDVTDSDNIGYRSQEQFCSSRNYNISDYNYVSIKSYNECIKYLNVNNISIRQILFSKYDHNQKYDSNVVFDKIRSIFSLMNLKHINNILKFLYDKQNSISYRDFIEFMELDEKSFCFIIPSYNNIDNYQINLSSVLNQNYQSRLFRIIYLDDWSDDNTYDKVLSITNQYYNKIQLIRPKLRSDNLRSKQGYARYIGFHLTFDDEILVLLDGDDWLYNQDVLTKLSQIYIKMNVWMTYGSYYIYDQETLWVKKSMNVKYNRVLHCTRNYPENIIADQYRNHDWICGHLRTGYSKIFKQIHVKDLLSPDGFFLSYSTDFAEMIPCLEMSVNCHCHYHCNMLEPMCVYNKYNSMQHSNSYYLNINNPKRKEILKYLKQRQVYSPIISLTMPMSIPNEYLSTIKDFNDINYDIIYYWLNVTNALCFISPDKAKMITKYHILDDLDNQHQIILFQFGANNINLDIDGIFNIKQMEILSDDLYSLDLQVGIGIAINNYENY